MKSDVCKLCGGNILWLKASGRSSIPVNPRPFKVLVKVLPWNVGGPPRDPEWELSDGYMPHLFTCRPTDICGGQPIVDGEPGHHKEDALMDEFLMPVLLRVDAVSVCLVGQPTMEVKGSIIMKDGNRVSSVSAKIPVSVKFMQAAIKEIEAAFKEAVKNLGNQPAKDDNQNDIQPFDYPRFSVPRKEGS